MLKVKIRGIQIIYLLPFLLLSCTMTQTGRFDRAVTDAAVVETKDVSTDLIPITLDNKDLIWNTDKTRVLMVMWKSRGSFEKFYKDGIRTDLSENYMTWVTAAPQVQHFAKAYLKNNQWASKADVDFRLKQYLGLKPEWTYDVFVELWVDPGDIFRPCVDPEIDDRVCNIQFSNKTPYGSPFLKRRKDMQLIFVHGWSVTNTDTYGSLPTALSNAAVNYGLELSIHHIYLGRYISFHDEVTMDDIARAMDRALRDLPGNSNDRIAPFSCITHSTGGPVVRFWADKFYGKDRLKDLPLVHLVMLAPANHGSALAVLGKARVGRIKAWFNGIEPGQRVLDWLSLGSDGQWELNHTCLDYDLSATRFFPFVFTGQGIDHSLFDFLNSYLVEKGSDGVVRVAGANMNYRCFSLVQTRDQVIKKQPLTLRLLPDKRMKINQPVALGVYNEYSHSGKKMGILRSIGEDDVHAPVVNDILKCFQVADRTAYRNRAEELALETKRAQEKGDRYCMLVFNVRDDQGEPIGKDDYDMFLLAGNQYQPKSLPKGFFMDRQMNLTTGRLIYYLDADKMQEIKNGKFGLRVIARPVKGFSYYAAAEYQSDGMDVGNILTPNQVTYVDITLHRFVDKNVFRLGPVTKKSVNFKRTKPLGEPVENN